MSSYLADTHTLLWWHEDSPQLSREVKGAFSNSENSIKVSVVSFWEIVIKQAIGKLKMEYSMEEITAACVDSNIEILPIQLYHLHQLSLLPLLHRDPCDRMIVATAYSENLTLISKDTALLAYNIKVLW